MTNLTDIEQQLRHLVHRYGGRWDLEVVSGPGAVLELRSLGFSIPIEEIYGDVFG